MPTLVTPLRSRREALGLTQGEVAKAAGLSRVAVGNLESGHGNPRLTTARALAGALGTDVDALFPALGAPLGDLRLMHPDDDPSVPSTPPLARKGGPVIHLGPEFRVEYVRDGRVVAEVTEGGGVVVHAGDIRIDISTPKTRPRQRRAKRSARKSASGDDSDPSPASSKAAS